jgi:hypothetical protein
METDQMKLGTADITKTASGAFIVSYLSQGSFLQGEQFFGGRDEARAFCRQRDLHICWKA